MKNTFLFLVFLGLCQNGWAQSILGSWHGSAVYSTKYQTSGGLCPSLAIDIFTNEKKELKLNLNYDCIWSSDWWHSHQLTFALDLEGNLLGEDGHLKNNEFYWDNALAYKGGTKIQLRYLTQDDSLSVEITEEDPNGGSNTPMYRASLHRAANSIPDRNLLKYQAQGKWTGHAEYIERDPKTDVELERLKCPIQSWEIPYDHDVWTQTFFYLPDCDQEKFRLWLGPFFFEYGKVFAYPRNQARNLVEVGTYDTTGIQVNNPDLNGPIQIDFINDNEMRIHTIEAFFDMTIAPFQHRKIERILYLKRL